MPLINEWIDKITNDPELIRFASQKILNNELMNIVYINCLTTNIELKLKNGVKFIDYVPLKFLTNNFYKTININYIAYQKTRYMNMIIFL